MQGPDETTWKVFDYAWAAVGGLLMIVWNMLNGRIAENHKAVNKRIDDLDKEDDKNKDHLAKLYQAAEQDRATFRTELADHRKDSFERHIELMKAINSKADK